MKIITKLKKEVETLTKLSSNDETDDKLIKDGAQFAEDAAKIEIQEAIGHLINAIHFLDKEKKEVKYEDIPDYD